MQIQTRFIHGVLQTVLTVQLLCSTFKVMAARLVITVYLAVQLRHHVTQEHSILAARHRTRRTVSVVMQGNTVASLDCQMWKAIVLQVLSIMFEI